MWVNSFTHMSCQSIRLLETIFSSSKTMSAYLQYGKELFAFPGHAIHTPLTGLLSPNPSRIDHPSDILGGRVHDCFPSHLPHFPNWNTSWLNNDNAFQKGGNNPRLLFSMRKRPIECIHKGGGHTRCYLQYIYIYIYIYIFVIITCECLYLFSTGSVNWGGLLFISMSIYIVLN